jgi:hypothetical protein
LEYERMVVETQLFMVIFAEGLGRCKTIYRAHNAIEHWGGKEYQLARMISGCARENTECGRI